MLTNNINRLPFIQRQTVIPNLHNFPHNKDLLLKLFKPQRIDENPTISHHTPPFTSTFTLSRVIPGIINRSEDALSDDYLNPKENTYEINMILVLSSNIGEKYKDTVFKKLTTKGIILDKGKKNNFPLDEIDFSQISEEDAKLLLDYSILSTGPKDGNENLNIIHIGSKVSIFIQDYLRENKLKGDLEAVWNFLKRNDRETELKLNTIPLDHISTA